jgi:hypothetical protein
MRSFVWAGLSLVWACSDPASVDRGIDGVWHATRVVTVDVSEQSVPGAAVSMLVPCMCIIRLQYASLRIDGARYTEEADVYYEFNGTTTHTQSSGRGTITYSGNRVTLEPDKGFHIWSEAARSGTIEGRRLTVDMGLRMWIYER